MFHVTDPVYQRWWFCCSWIADDLEAVQGLLLCQAWICEGAGLDFAGICWLCPLKPSLGEEPAVASTACLDQWHVQPQGTIVSSCLWTSFRVPSPQLFWVTVFWSLIVWNKGYHSQQQISPFSVGKSSKVWVNWALILPCSLQEEILLQVFILWVDQSSRPGHHETKPCSADLVFWLASKSLC